MLLPGELGSGSWVPSPGPEVSIPGEVCPTQLLEPWGWDWPLFLSHTHTNTHVHTHSLAGLSGSPALSPGPAVSLAFLRPPLPNRATLATRWPLARSSSSCIFLSPPPG